MVFYLFFPFLFRMCGTFVRSLVFFVLSVAVSFLCREMIYRSGLSIDVASSFYNTSLSRHLPSFAAGLMIFHIYRNYIREKEVSRWIGLAGIAAACVAYSFWVNSSLSPLWDIVAMDIIYGVLALGLIIAPLGLVVNRVTRFIGEISYSIYLGHVPVISVLPILGMIYAASFPIAGKFFVSFVAITAATILLSVGTYYLIEKPGMLLGKKLIEILNRGSPRSKRQSVTVSLDVSDKSAT